MKQEAAQQIIDQAGQHRQIAADLDATYTKRYKPGWGFRVRLEHRFARRVLVIDSQEQWQSVLQAWSNL